MAALATALKLDTAAPIEEIAAIEVIALTAAKLPTYQSGVAV
jgi:hypothetical protein